MCIWSLFWRLWEVGNLHQIIFSSHIKEGFLWYAQEFCIHVIWIENEKIYFLVKMIRKKENITMPITFKFINYY